MSVRHFLNAAKRLAAEPGLSDRLPAEPGERSWLKLSGPEGWDSWLIAWPSGTGTPWHDHQGSSGAFFVVSGSLTEFSLPRNHGSVPVADDLVRLALTAGHGRSFHERHIHQVYNDQPTTAYSAHVYSPRLTGMSRYEWVGGQLALAEVELAGASW